MNKIYLSSFKLNYLKSVNKIYDFCLKNKIQGIEFSGGKHQKSLNSQLKKIKKINFLFHNYFPVPKKGFVLNLASDNKLIEKKSMKHILKSINLSKKFNLKYFSFHAGYLYDPPEKFLDKKIKLVKLMNRKLALERFIKNLKKICKYAKKCNVFPLLENNNFSEDELRIFGKSTVLMADISETLKIMKNLNKHAGILVDVGHLNVASRSLKFSKIKYLKKCEKWIFGYHFSNNDGINDQNKLVKKSSWFWPYIKKNLEYYSLEVSSVNIKDILNNLNLIKRKIL